MGRRLRRLCGQACAIRPMNAVDAPWGVAIEHGNDQRGATAARDSFQGECYFVREWHDLVPYVVRVWANVLVALAWGRLRRGNTRSPHKERRSTHRALHPNVTTTAAMSLPQPVPPSWKVGSSPCTVPRRR